MSFGNPYDHVAMAIDGHPRKIKHFASVTVADTEVDFFSSYFGSLVGEGGSADALDVYKPVYHLRMVVTNDATMRVNINNCASSAAGILVDYEHPLDIMMAVTLCKAVRVGTTSATVEVTIWY